MLNFQQKEAINGLTETECHAIRVELMRLETKYAILRLILAEVDDGLYERAHNRSL